MYPTAHQQPSQRHAKYPRGVSGLGAPQLTLQPCYQFSLNLNLQGATSDEVKASLTWASSVRNLSITTFGSGTTLTGTWNGTTPFTVPTSIPVAHNFGGNTGWQTVQVLVTGGSNGALDTTGGCVPLPPTCPAGTYWNGNACIHQVVFQPPGQQGGQYNTPQSNTGGTQQQQQQQPAATATSPWVYVGAGVAALAVVGGVAYYAMRAKKNPLGLYYPAPFRGRADGERFDNILGAARHGDARYGKGNYVVKFEERRARANPALKGETSGTFTLRLEERRRRARRNPVRGSVDGNFNLRAD